MWCSSDSHVDLKPGVQSITKKTKELIVDFRKHSTDPAPLYISVWRGATPSGSWALTCPADNITAVIKKAQQRLHLLRVLRKHNLDSNLLLIH